MRPVPVFPDYSVKLVIPASCAILKPAVIDWCVSLFVFAITGVGDFLFLGSFLVVTESFLSWD